MATTNGTNGTTKAIRTVETTSGALNDPRYVTTDELIAETDAILEKIGRHDITMAALMTKGAKSCTTVGCVEPRIRPNALKCTVHEVEYRTAAKARKAAKIAAANAPRYTAVRDGHGRWNVEDAERGEAIATGLTKKNADREIASHVADGE
jgi:hypothetical protein